jgi:TolB protein
MKKNIFWVGILSMMLVFMVALAGCSSLFKRTTTTDTIITVASSTLQNVVRVTDNKLRKNSIRVSPDGKKLLYCEANETNPDVELYLEDFRIMLLRDITVSSKTPLVTEPSFGPVWFDDNVGFAYVSYELSGSKLVKSSIAGGGKTYITRTSAGDADANPSIKGNRILCDTLDGERILSDGRRFGKRQLVSMKDNGTEITFLGEGEQPSWHPSGTKFVFIRRTEERRGTSTFYSGSVYEMDIQTSQVTQIYTAVIDENNGFAEVCSRPSYSANGEYILFAKGGDVHLATVEKKVTTAGKLLGSLFAKRSASYISARRLHLFLMKADGTDLTQLTSGNVEVFSPAWGANNDIFFISNVQGATEIWKAHLNL